MIYKEQIIEEGFVAQLKREIEIQAGIDHPRCCPLFGYSLTGPRICIALPLYEGGSMYELMQKETRFDQRSAMDYVHQVASALVYLHARGVIHRDLKPENLLLDGEGNAVVADFGWSYRAQQDEVIARHTLCGTLDYLPPEMIEDEPYGPSVDCWSLGVLAYEFVVGRPPFEAETEDVTYDRIFEARPWFPGRMHAGVRDLIGAILVVDTEARLNAQGVLVVRLLHASGLKAMDRNGSSDPYAKLSLAGGTRTSKVRATWLASTRPHPPATLCPGSNPASRHSSQEEPSPQPCA